MSCTCEPRGSNDNFSKKRKCRRNARHFHSMGAHYYLSHIRSYAAITRSRCPVGGPSDVFANAANELHKFSYVGLGKERCLQWM